MRTHFDPDVRVLACDNCGAPLEAGADAADLACSYCGAQNRVVVPTAVTPAPSLSPEEQRRRLSEQVGRPRPPSPAVADYLDGERLASWREREALDAWIEARRKIRAEDADQSIEARFFQLTRLLADTQHRAGEGLRERALLESGYEMSPLSRRRTYFAALLAQRAVLAGDRESAQTWIQRCDAGVDDLEAYSALTIARAMERRLAGGAEEVLGAVGDLKNPAPLTDADQGLGAVLRADALEKLGRLDEAVDTLERFVTSRWPKTRGEVVLAREMLGQDTCPKAMAALDERRGHEFGKLHRYNAKVCIGFTFLWGGMGVACVVGAFFSTLWVLIGGAAGLAIGGGLIWAAVDAFRDQHAWKQPVWATVREVKQPTDNHMGSAQLVLDDAPKKLETALVKDGNVVEPKMRVLVARTADRVRFLS
jgi:uncharacterized Zn finger protein (UPF0148 family)